MEQWGNPKKTTLNCKVDINFKASKYEQVGWIVIHQLEVISTLLQISSEILPCTRLTTNNWTLINFHDALRQRCK